VLADVGVGPEVERELHRLAVLGPEERLDVRVEGHGGELYQALDIT